MPHMMRQRYGKIVCISSGAREGTPWTAYYQGGAAYSAAKAAMLKKFFGKKITKQLWVLHVVLN
ncbi:MAG: hypothetical protein P8X91_09400 [Candidatus Bathyarchaeota archaeon]